MVPVYDVTSLGAVAARLLRDAVAGRVENVFTSSLHVAFPAGILCLVASDLGNGPLNAIVAEPTGAPWRPSGVTVGLPVHVAADRLAIADVVSFSLAPARVWTPAEWPTEWQPSIVCEALRRLAAEAAPRCPADGLAAAIFSEPASGGLGGAVARRALLATATLADWLSIVLEPDATPDPDVTRAACTAVHRLVGLGPGLTPAGDDVLCGLLVALHAAGARDVAVALGAFVAAAPPASTSALSRAFLAAAAEGHPGEAMAAVITAVLTNAAPGFAADLDRIDAIGHTSGWDMLAGAVMGLSAVAAARTDPT